MAAPLQLPVMHRVVGAVSVQQDQTPPNGNQVTVNQPPTSQMMTPTTGNNAYLSSGGIQVLQQMPQLPVNRVAFNTGGPALVTLPPSQRTANLVLFDATPPNRLCWVGSVSPMSECLTPNSSDMFFLGGTLMDDSPSPHVHENFASVVRQTVPVMTSPPQQHAHSLFAVPEGRPALAPNSQEAQAASKSEQIKRQISDDSTVAPEEGYQSSSSASSSHHLPFAAAQGRDGSTR